MLITSAQEDYLLPLPNDVPQKQPEVPVDQHWLVCLPQHKPEQYLLFLKVCTQDIVIYKHTTSWGNYALRKNTQFNISIIRYLLK